LSVGIELVLKITANMAINQDDFLPENYAPNYRKETDSFPAATGLFGRQIAKDKPVATQKLG